MSASNTVIVKFLAAGDPAALSAKICELVGNHRVKQAHQLFPGESDEELASMFEVALEDTVSVAEAVGALRRDDQIEYAHTPQSRRPL